MVVSLTYYESKFYVSNLLIMSYVSILFDDRFIFPIQCAMQSLNILNSFVQLTAENPVWQNEAEIIDNSGALICFDLL